MSYMTNACGEHVSMDYCDECGLLVNAGGLADVYLPRSRQSDESMDLHALVCRSCVGKFFPNGWKEIG